MNAPRVKVGLIGSEHISFSRYLSNAGNPVERIQDLDDIKNFEAILIDVRDDELSDVVLDLVPRVREGQIIIHNCPGQPAEALQPLADYLTFCAAVVPLNPQGTLFFCEALGELAENLIELLVMEVCQAAAPGRVAPRILSHGPRTAKEALAVIENARSAMRAVMGTLGPAEGQIILAELLREQS